ncbi:MAG: hypothetical protein JST01_19235 [Cyanobacteria bacterium SZAS TMP-1]|nr:hypothetical protein [Cyanobacteria bacterium SZAS TMP-1]
MGSSHKEHYVSGAIQGEAQKINLEEVHKAFFETKGADFNAQMAAFEKRVNEIYEGEGVVALDATRENNRLVVTGFISKSNKPGFQPGDEKLFTIEQTGDVVNNDMPYRVAGYDGRPYYEGHRSILDSPLVQMMVLSHMMGGFGGRYYTPYSSYGGLMGYRNTWRATPQYSSQKASNTNFFSRFSKKSDGGLQSATKFGGGSFSGGEATARRSWGGFGPSSSTSTSSSGWGGRRSPGIGTFSGFGGGRRGWGGRRGR